MPLDERVIWRILSQVEERLRRAPDHGQIQITLAGRRYNVKSLQAEADDNE